MERGIAMLGQATEALMQRSGGRRLILLVDDAQWLDDASALLFQQLVLSEGYPGGLLDVIETGAVRVLSRGGGRLRGRGGPGCGSARPPG